MLRYLFFLLPFSKPHERYKAKNNLLFPRLLADKWVSYAERRKQRNARTKNMPRSKKCYRGQNKTKISLLLSLNDFLDSSTSGHLDQEVRM